MESERDAQIPHSVSDTSSEVMATLGSFARYMERLPTAFAVTRGDHHAVVYANEAFRALLTRDERLTLGAPIGDAFEPEDASILIPLLDRAFRTGVVSRNRSFQAANDRPQQLRCTVWPDLTTSGNTEHLLIEMRIATAGEVSLALQRQVAERLLLSALREQDAATLAHASWRSAAFLATESRRLAESLDEEITLSAMKRMSLPRLGAWCIVDTLDDENAMHRLAIIHPDPEKQEILQSLGDRWIPRLGDTFGLPAALRIGTDAIVVDDGEVALRGRIDDPLILNALHALEVGPLLTVPLLIAYRITGAVTFVGDHHGRQVMPEDIDLAMDLANQSVMALERARAHGEEITLKQRAESASKAKSAFLGMMSHELRTPLSAIGGFVDLLDMGLRGPVTVEQHSDLARIRTNQQYLTRLIDDLLNFTAVGSGRLTYSFVDLKVRSLITTCVDMLEPLFAKHRLAFECTFIDDELVALGDRQKATQILLILLSNSIKFTAPGGRIGVRAHATGASIQIRVTDTGSGIPTDKLETIFEPFTQVREGLTGTNKGVGLGLAIGRDLARAMGGDLTVVSTLDAGATFTLTLPRGTDNSAAIGDSRREAIAPGEGPLPR